jgi:hypothetical protein
LQVTQLRVNTPVLEYQTFSSSSFTSSGRTGGIKNGLSCKSSTSQIHLFCHYSFRWQLSPTPKWVLCSILSTGVKDTSNAATGTSTDHEIERRCGRLRNDFVNERYLPIKFYIAPQVGCLPVSSVGYHQQLPTPPHRQLSEGLRYSAGLRKKFQEIHHNSQTFVQHEVNSSPSCTWT